jgi:hypothetical protein
MLSVIPLGLISTHTNQADLTRLYWFGGIVAAIFIVFIFFFFPFTNRIDTWCRKRLGKLLGVKLTYSNGYRRSFWKVEGHPGKDILVGFLHFIFILIFYFGPFVLPGLAFLFYYWMYGFPE